MILAQARWLLLAVAAYVIGAHFGAFPTIGATLVLVPFFLAALVWVSPSPANGPKLLVFSALLALQFKDWGHDVVVWDVWFVALGAVACLFVACHPASGRKLVRWSVGWKLLGGAVVLGAGVAALGVSRLVAVSDVPLPWTSFDQEGVVFFLVILLSAFLATRASADARAQGAAVLASAGLLALAIVLDPDGWRGRWDVARMSAALGALYAITHCGRPTTAIWPAIAIALAFPDRFSFAALAVAAASLPVARRIRGAVFSLALSALFVVFVCESRFMTSRGRPLEPWSALDLLLVTSAVALLAAGVAASWREPSRAPLVAFGAFAILAFVVQREAGDAVMGLISLLAAASGLLARPGFATADSQAPVDSAARSPS
jgi:hypothetical protein